nr:hypothetical protein [Rhodovibrio sodomensis]
MTDEVERVRHRLRHVARLPGDQPGQLGGRDRPGQDVVLVPVLDRRVAADLAVRRARHD